MSNFQQLFGRLNSVIIGMVHTRALPGTPRHRLSMDEIIEKSCKEAAVYRDAHGSVHHPLASHGIATAAKTLQQAADLGDDISTVEYRYSVDGILVENMHDLPWLTAEKLGPEITASMTAICKEIRRECPHIPIGIQVLTAANKEALAIAKATGLDFIRAEGYVFSHIGDEGPIHSCAAELLRYRRHIDAEHIQVFTDIKKKHSSHAITADVDIMETAKAAEMFHSDGLIITGTATGDPTDPEEVLAVQKSVAIPVLVGSGVTEENIRKYMKANGIIIGSHLKMHGLWFNDLDPMRVNQVVAKVGKMREQAQEAKEKSKGKKPNTFRTMTAEGE